MNLNAKSAVLENERATEPTSVEALHPWDVHNRKLYANVHPPDWVNPAPARRYNLVVIGGGTAGLVTAAGAAGLGVVAGRARNAGLSV